MKLTLALLSVVPVVLSTAAAQQAKLVSTARIWDAAEHNAFTDLVRFRDRWFCAFREGSAHVSPDGVLRIISSVDGMAWESAARITSPDADLRDPKITITPDGRLMLTGAKALHDPVEKTHQSVVWFSTDGFHWTDGRNIGDPNFWLWRITWNQGTAFAIGYSCGKERLLRLYASSDGEQFVPRVENLYDEGDPNETSIIFSDQTAYCLLRRDGNPATGMIGSAQAPFTDWKWMDLGVRIGGPRMLQLENDRLVAAVRLVDAPVRTSLCWVNPLAGKLTEFLALPSGGDTGYAGVVFHDGLLWVSYYSSHEGKASIYLAKVALSG